jgi:hypothetical protein
MKFWPRPSGKKDMRARRIVGYVILLAIAAISLGVVGCVAAVTLIALLEAARGAFAV